jgi:GGDEF domain-containing protein
MTESRLNSRRRMESAMAISESVEAQRLLMENLSKAMAHCGSQGTHLALILIELARRGDFGANGCQARETETTFLELLRAAQAHCGRDRDRVMRLSSDRMAAICPNTHAAGASHIAARIREAAVFLPSRRGLPLPLAIGVAVSGPDSGENANDLLQRAQRTLESARTHPSSLLSVTGAAAPPAQRPSLLACIIDWFRGSSASPCRRLGE